MYRGHYRIGWETVEHVGGGAALASHAPRFMRSLPPVDESGVSPYAHLRRANPVNTILPLAQKWLENLPDEVRPRHLAEQFPRLVNLIALEWRGARGAGNLLTDLVGDRRVGRRGFPPLVHNELLALLGLAYLRQSPRN